MVKRLGIFLFIILSVAGCKNQQSETAPVIKTDVKTYFALGKDCENHIIKEVNNTNSTLDIAVYSITNKPTTDAVINAYKHGVKVRIITDRAQAKIKSASAPKLRDAGIPVITNKKHKIMHHKFAIFDNERVVSGSYNWTGNATKHNAENCDFFNLPDDEYPTRFRFLWNMYTRL